MSNSIHLIRLYRLGKVALNNIKYGSVKINSNYNSLLKTSGRFKLTLIEFLINSKF